MVIDSFKDVYAIEKTYYWQVVNYFMTMDTLEELTFFLYNPDIYDIDKQHYSIVVTRDELQEDIDKAFERLAEFEVKLNKLKLKLK